MKNIKFDFLWQYVEYWANLDPNYIAMQIEGKSYTYGQFEKLTDNIATEFLSLGVRKGDMIASMLPASPEYILTLIAADKIGAIVTALDVKYKTADLKNFIPHIKPKVVLSLVKSEDFDVANALKNIEGELKLENTINYFFVGNAEFGKPFDNIYKGKPEFITKLAKHKTLQHRDDGMVVIFTGGTTGMPKAALLSKQNVAAMAVAESGIISKALEEKGIVGRVKSIVCLPPSHVGGTVELIGSSIVSGSEMLIHDTWSPKRVLNTVQNEKIFWIGGVPTMYAIMTLMPDIDQYDLSSLKMVLLSGEKVEKKLLQQIRSKICPNLLIGYGSTEAGSELTFTEFSDSDDKLADGYVGKALKGVDIKIVDDNGNILPYGEIGEIQISGQFTINNYYQEPEEDEAGFTKDGYCKTGDKGYLTEDGDLYIKGRIKHIIRVGSYTVMPSEVEDVAIKHPSVGMAAAIGVPDEVLGEVVWLVVSPKQEKTIKEEELIEFCKNELAKYKVPQKVIIEKELPVSRIGKVLRVEIQNTIIKSLKEGIMDKSVSYKQEGKIGIISLINSAKSNPLNLITLNEIVDAFYLSAKNGDVCVIYRAEGKHFTFGADLKYVNELVSSDDKLDESDEYSWAWQKITTAMLEHPGIIIVGYHGWVVGGGFEHTLGSDIRLAADNTKIMLPELDLGVFFSNGSTKLLPAIIGEGRAKQLMIMGEKIDAQKAYDFGLINAICKSEELDDLLMAYAKKVVSKDQVALKNAKKLINKARSSSLDTVLDDEGKAMMAASRSESTKQRILSFLKIH